MNRNFLKEAIADAKAVKESAIANAKVALEEAFTPQVQAMFAQKVNEMDIEEEEESNDEVTEAKAKKEYKDDDRKDGGESKETKRTEEIKYGKDLAESEVDEDLNLDEILAELEKDDTSSKNLKEAESDEETEEEGYEDGMEDEKEDMDDEEDIDLEDMSEDDLKSFIEDVIEDMVTAGELEAGEDFEVNGEEAEDEDIDIDVEDDTDVTIDEAEEIDEKQKFNAKLGDALGGKHGRKKQDMKQRRADSENMEKADGKRKYAGDAEMDQTNEDLNEAYATVKALRTELNDINLLNAKLLYTNKVFRGKNLTEAQKVKVLGAFDKAETVKEAKLVFETINGSIKSTTTKSISENFKSKGSASNLTSTPKVSKKKPIVESNEMVLRFKKLAGIIS